MSLLAETSVLVGDTDSAAVLYRLLLPYSAFNAVDWARASGALFPATSVSWRR
jgi:hypothetical protein